MKLNEEAAFAFVHVCTNERFMENGIGYSLAVHLHNSVKFTQLYPGFKL